MRKQNGTSVQSIKINFDISSFPKFKNLNEKWGKMFFKFSNLKWG